MISDDRAAPPHSRPSHHPSSPTTFFSPQRRGETLVAPPHRLNKSLPLFQQAYMTNLLPLGPREGRQESRPSTKFHRSRSLHGPRVPVAGNDLRTGFRSPENGAFETWSGQDAADWNRRAKESGFVLPLPDLRGSLTKQFAPHRGRSRSPPETIHPPPTQVRSCKRPTSTHSGSPAPPPWR